MEYEVIGTRPNSAFRVGLYYFYDKRDRFQAFQDPTTGGPVKVVYAGTDDEVDSNKVTMIRDRKDSRYGKIFIDESPTPTATK